MSFNINDLKGRLDPTSLLDVIQTQSEIVHLGPDLASVMALVVERARELTGCDGAAIELLEDHDMVYRAASGIAWPQLGLRLKAETSLSGYCVRLGEPVYCADAELDPRVDLAACHKVGLRSMVVYPLRHEQNCVGVLKVLSRKVDAFSENAQVVVQLLCELIASTMYYATRTGSAELHKKATTDMLTGLGNRALLHDRLLRRLGQATRHDGSFAILFADMDGLKPINDSMGHQAGDAVLCEFANRLQRNLREGDLAVRLGGDEFAVLLNHVADRNECAQAQARFQHQVEQDFVWQGRHLPLAASFGAALYPADGQTLEILLNHADQVMYQAKATRKAAKSAAPRR
jgi:diguanylate cyclase (GGDEF)-like protein